MARISLIVPIYNAEKYIEECIESILQQSYREFEVILVDDGSLDRSFSLCKRYEKQDRRIRVFHKKNGGVSSARNLGMKEATGDYITFVDADDVILSDYCEFLLEKILESQCDVVYGGCSKWYDKRIVYKKPRCKDGIYHKDTLLPYFIDDGKMRGFLVGGCVCALYKREVLEKNDLFFHPDIDANEDGLFNLMYVLHSNNICMARKYSIYLYRMHEASFTHASSNCFLFLKLHEILKKIDLKYPQYGFEKQLQARKVSIALWRILHLSNQDISYEEGIKLIRNTCDPLRKEELYLVKIKELSPYIKAFYYAIVKKKYTLLWFMAKYLYPILSKILSR